MDFDHSQEIITPDITNILTISGQALELPTGTTSTRPSSAVDGAIRFNTESNQLEILSTEVWSTIPTAVTGNAASATKLQTPRTINGVEFDGTTNITISATSDASLLTGTTLASNVVNSALTSVGSLTTLNVSGYIRASSHLLIGDAINHANIANVWVSGTPSGTTADRPINFIDTSAVMKIARVGGNPALELQEWDSTLTTQTAYWDIVSFTGGNLQFRDRVNNGSNVRLEVNQTTGNITIGSDLVLGAHINLSKASGIALKIDNGYGWRDLIGDITPRLSGTTAPTLKTFYGNLREFSYSVGDIGDIRFHMPHDYAPGTDIYLHVHWSHNGTAISGALQVDFTASYAKGFGQAVFSSPISSSITTPTVTISNAPRYTHRIDEVLLSTPGGSASLLDTSLLEVDGFIMINYITTTIPSISGGASTTPFIIAIDIHYQSTGLPTKNKAPSFYA